MNLLKSLQSASRGKQTRRFTKASLFIYSPQTLYILTLMFSVLSEGPSRSLTPALTQDDESAMSSLNEGMEDWFVCLSIYICTYPPTHIYLNLLTSIYPSIHSYLSIYPSTHT